MGQQGQGRGGPLAERGQRDRSQPLREVDYRLSEIVQRSMQLDHAAQAPLPRAAHQAEYGEHNGGQGVHGVMHYRGDRAAYGAGDGMKETVQPAEHQVSSAVTARPGWRRRGPGLRLPRSLPWRSRASRPNAAP